MTHQYNISVQWTGNRGSGTYDYRTYDRSHSIIVKGKKDILGSSDPAFRGDAEKHNPEDLFISALSACHMLWYLHLCADHGIVVLSYEDHASGTLEIDGSGSGHFTQVVLQPEVVVQDASMIERALALHAAANEKCFIANSCNFKISHLPSCKTID